MKITCITSWRIAPPKDVWNLVSVETDNGLVGWGEWTGSGHESAAAAILAGAAQAMLGQDALDVESLLAPFRQFTYPPITDKIATVAWSAIAQALWDIRGQAFGQPLVRLFGGTPKPVRLYANLNRGLSGDRSPDAHARHAEQALAAGFAAAKCTPFDHITPATIDEAALHLPLERLRAATRAVGPGLVAIDAHCRLSPALAGKFLSMLSGIGAFAWLEDATPPCHHTRLAEMRSAYPGIVWAGGEEIRNINMTAELLSGSAKPDIFMPDIKYVCGLDEFAALACLATAQGCRVYPHNPSGPVSLAFSAHMAALTGGSMVEYPFLAIPDQRTLVTPREPLEKGYYILGDRPGLGTAPSGACLEQFGTKLAVVSA